MACAHPHVLTVGELRIAPAARTAHWRGAYLDLSPKEFDILRLLAERHDQVLSRQAIWEAAWSEYRIPPQVNVIDVTLSRLRGKLEAAEGPRVENVRKQGFVLRTPVVERGRARAESASLH